VRIEGERVVRRKTLRLGPVPSLESERTQLKRDVKQGRKERGEGSVIKSREPSPGLNYKTGCAKGAFTEHVVSHKPGEAFSRGGIGILFTGDLGTIGC
jgi:hypothetical protein